MQADFEFIKAKFKDNYKQYIKHFTNFEKFKYYKIVWSASYMDFFDFESNLEGRGQAKIYIKKPPSNTSMIKNRIIDNKLIYSTEYLYSEWGSEFYFDEDKSMARLFYNNQNNDKKIMLSQITYKTMNNNLVEKVLFYMFDADMKEEQFYKYNFEYEGNKISKIIRLDYFYPKNNIRYKIEYNNEIYKIYGKIKDAEVLIYPKNNGVRRNFT